MTDVDAMADGGLRLLSLLSSMLAFAVHVRQLRHPHRLHGGEAGCRSPYRISNE